MVGHVRAGLQDVLVEPSVFASRDTLSAGGPIPCQGRNPISNKRPRFCLYTIYVEREMQAFCQIDIYLYLDTIIISEKILISKMFWVIVR